MADAATPRATKVLLVGVLATACTATAWYLLAAPADDPRAAGRVLLLLTVLFLGRVIGQVAVALRAPSWLPPMSQWNLLPYRYLLPIQLVFLSVMGVVCAPFLDGSDDGALTTPRTAVGAAVVVVSGAYAGAMVIRYVVRMRRRPEQRWFGGTIPIVFHWVLAAFLLVYGVYNLRAA
jgi:uncharacterized protein